MNLSIEAENEFLREIVAKMHACCDLIVNSEDSFDSEDLMLVICELYGITDETLKMRQENRSDS